jgi:hypothetical protein
MAAAWSAGPALRDGAWNSQRPRSAGPLLAGHLILDLSAVTAGHERLGRFAREGADICHLDGGHHCTRRLVDRECLSEDAMQTDVHEPVAQQFVRALAGQP